MKNIILKIIIINLAITTTVFAQNYKIEKDDFNKTVNQISESLPSDWSVKTDTTYPDEIIIQSTVIDLYADMTSNDPPFLKGQCEIYIMIVPKISPDSIKIIRKRNIELQNSLPPQGSKDNLKNWNTQNEKILKILDSEPTNYDNKYSYRIKCRRLPKNEIDVIKYNKIISFLNRQFEKYQD